MGIRFTKSIKLGNYLRLNLSKSGVSATVGRKGASVNVGKHGTFLNLSPSLLGVNGTGISYRTKIMGGLGGLAGLGSKKKNTKKKEKETSVPGSVRPTSAPSESAPKEQPVQTGPTPAEILATYERNQEAKIHIHKYADPVRTREDFDRTAAELDSEAARELYELNIAGDEDTIENFICTFMNNLELAYDVRVNYELEDHILYADLDLPEIENISAEYPALSRGKIVQKTKTAKMLREEYAQTVMSLGVFLSACFFNESPYIEQVVMSGFTSVRNKDGDLVDQYLYSVKYTRDVFEKTDLSGLDDLYGFILRFENRINLSSASNFKPVTPYEMESVAQMNAMVEDAVLALKEWGYKTADINRIYPELSRMQLESVADYLREGLRLLGENSAD